MADMRVQVTAIHEHDSFYPRRSELIGKCGTFRPFNGRSNTQSNLGSGWNAGFLELDSPPSEYKKAQIYMHKLLGEPVGLCFAGVQFEVLESR